MFLITFGALAIKLLVTNNQSRQLFLVLKTLFRGEAKRCANSSWILAFSFLERILGGETFSNFRNCLISWIFVSADNSSEATLRGGSHLCRKMRDQGLVTPGVIDASVVRTVFFFLVLQFWKVWIFVGFSLISCVSCECSLVETLVGWKCFIWEWAPMSEDRVLTLYKYVSCEITQWLFEIFSWERSCVIEQELIL